MSARGAQSCRDEVRTVALILVEEEAVRKRAIVNVGGGIDFEAWGGRGDWTAYADCVRTGRRETVKIKRIDVGITGTPGAQVRSDRHGTEDGGSTGIFQDESCAGFCGGGHQVCTFGGAGNIADLVDANVGRLCECCHAQDLQREQESESEANL